MNDNSNVVFAPASKAQEQFLTSDADITFYGGRLVPPFKTYLIR